ncbi:MAG: NUDIX domain-containing protein [Clostridia bacterium]|nr:NUDIX domain-containing protein [Clostridia bacterium]
MEKTLEKRQSLQCKIYPLNTLSPYKYVVVCARCGDRWLLSRHKKRETWETQGGHIEQGETPLDAARRELYEESGADEADFYPVCDYYGYDAHGHANGMVFLAVIRHRGTLPESEMKEVRLFDKLPENLTYPHVSPVLYAEAEKVLNQTEE